MLYTLFPKFSPAIFNDKCRSAKILLKGDNTEIDLYIVVGVISLTPFNNRHFFRNF